jgi:uncharacterized SAM-dependent methyltransferase
VTVDGHAVRLAPGESIWTENSYKFTLEGFARIAHDAGFEVECAWTDPARLFSVHLLRAAAR